MVLHDVLLVPDLKANLISLCKLANAGVSTSTDGARTYKGQLGNRVLWYLHESKDVLQIHPDLGSRIGQWDTDAWGIVTGRSKKPLELVHMELVGPLPVQGHKGERYFLTIVDDWSRLMWAYPLKQKDHAASTIREDWLPFMEKQAECVVKQIQRELTSAYSPQSNGVAERVNQTILETARALLIESGVGNSMWPHAVRHTTVARNRVLTKVGNESWVLLERWLGKKLLVDMLRVFGCMAVAHVPKKYRSKLGASAIWCVHLGLGAESKGWLLWEPSRGVLFDSRDVKFVEGMMYGGWKKQPETKVSQQMEQITMQLDLTPSVWEEGEEAAAEGGDGEKVQEEPAGGGGGVEASGGTSEAAGPESEQQQGKAKAPTLPQTEQQLGDEEALLILPHGYDPDDEDEPAYCFLAPAPEEPASMEEALAGPDREKWLVSRDAKYHSLLKNGTWDLVVLPEGKKAVQCKWVQRIKTDDKGQVTIYKSRLVAKGFMQKEKQDFNEIFAPTAKPPTLRVLLADAAVSGKFIIQVDISTAFLNGILEEDVYMTQPPGYEDGTGRVCKLKKSIYGLKQVPRCWYQKLAAVLDEMGFRTSSCDESLFLKGEGEKLVLFLVYVDDILLFSSSMKEIQKVQQQLMKNFKCKTLGEAKYYLGMHVERDPDHRWLKLHQEKFIKELGEKYGIENERKVATPLPAEFKLVKAAKDEGAEAEEQQQFQSLVGSLLYAAVHTRPGISFSARVVQNPSEEQVDAAERVVKYLSSYPSVEVKYSASAQVKQKGVEVLKEKGDRLGEGKLFLTCFTDATWASQKDNSSSVGGYICVVGGGPVSRRSKKQTEMALSSVESEYMAMFHGVKEMIWLRRLLEEIGKEHKVPTPLYSDSKGALGMARNAVGKTEPEVVHDPTTCCFFQPGPSYATSALDRGGEFSSDFLRDFCYGEGITQSFTLQDSPQQNGIAEHRIGLLMEVAPCWMGKVGDALVFRVWGSRAFVSDTSADKLSARAIPCVFLGFPPDAPGWQFYHPTSRRLLLSQDVTFDELVPFYRLFPYCSAPPPPPPLFLPPGPPPVDPLPPQGPAPLGVSQVDPPSGTAPFQVVVVSGAAPGTVSGGAASRGAASRGAEPGGAASGGAASGGAEPGGAGFEGAGSGGAEPEGVDSGGAESEGAEPGGAESEGAESGASGAGEPGDTGAGGAAVTNGPRDLTEPGAAGAGGDGAGVAGVGGPGAEGAGAAGAGAVDPGAGGAGGTVRPCPYFVPLLQQVLGIPSSTGLRPPFLYPPPDRSQPPLQPASPLLVPSPYTEQSGGLTERREPASRPVSPVHTARRAPHLRPPPVPSRHTMALRPSSVPLRPRRLPAAPPPLSVAPPPTSGPATYPRPRHLPVRSRRLPAAPPPTYGPATSLSGSAASFSGPGRRPLNSPAEPPSSRAAQQPSRPAAEQLSRRAAQQPSHRAALPSSCPAAEQPSRPAAEQPSHPAAEQPSCRAAQQPSRQAALQPSRPSRPVR
ncbi:unnamed protein product [Closterium sp. NIES-53]